MFFSKPHIIKSSDAELHLKKKKKRKGFPVTFAKKNLKQFVQSIFMSSRWELWRKERTRIHMGSLFCMFLIWTLVSGKFPVKVFVFQKKKKEWSRALFVLLPSFSIIQSFLFPNIHKKIYHFLSVKPLDMIRNSPSITKSIQQASNGQTYRKRDWLWERFVCSQQTFISSIPTAKYHLVH